MTFRDGSATDLAATFELSEVALRDTAIRQGVIDDAEPPLEPAGVRISWQRQRGLIEYLAARPNGRYVICEGLGGPIGYARVVRFDGMEQLTELMVDPAHQGQGIGRALLERCWPGDPTPELGRVVVAPGTSADLTLYSQFGVMPVAGHWHMRARLEDYLPRRTAEVDMVEPRVHARTNDRAVEAWARLEPGAVGHERRGLHEFFARERSCLALLGEDDEPAGLCWVSSEGEIGPAVAATAGELVPVVLAALDRVAKTQEPETLSVFATSLSWWLLRRLRRLGFQVFWPSWVMCSVPLPGLDRYVPTRPPQVL